MNVMAVGQCGNWDGSSVVDELGEDKLQLMY